jgi:hypothetical protein
MPVSDTISCRAQLSTIRARNGLYGNEAGEPEGASPPRSATSKRGYAGAGSLIARRHMGGISGSDLMGPHHRTASDEQRCGPTIGYRGLTPDPGSRARDAASNWTPFPTRMTTSRCIKEWAWTSLLISCANNRFVRREFITCARARSHLFDAGRRLVREPCGRARRRAPIARCPQVCSARKSSTAALNARSPTASM